MEFTTWCFVGFCLPFECPSAPQGQKDQLQKERQRASSKVKRASSTSGCAGASLLNWQGDWDEKKAAASAVHAPAQEEMGDVEGSKEDWKFKLISEFFSSTMSHCVQRVKPMGRVYGKGHARRC